jgi:putative membrane protein
MCLWGWNYWIIWLLIILLVIGMGYYLRGGRKMPGSQNSSDILNERYARGEIDRETYLRMKKDLEGK